MPAFTRLVRFLARNGRTYYGDAILPKGTTDISKASQARVIQGEIFGQHTVTDQIADIRLLLQPLSPTDAGTVRCLGLNYARHAQETSSPIPTYPILFHKPATSLAGPRDSIPVPPHAQIPGLDYECELVVVIGRAGIDISESAALDHVLGYAVGNDISHREWQVKRGGGQWGLGKGCDGWAPFGPGIVTREVIGGEPSSSKKEGEGGLKIGTRLNGKVVQESTTADMIFGVKQMVAFLSRGTTLLPGDVIFTGTPQGVGSGRKPPLWLKDGDMVEVELEGVGTCVNKVEWVGKGGPKL